MTTPNPVLRIGARVLLLDQADRVLLIHARDPDDPNDHWWELPGGGVDPGETLTDTAIREVAEETGIVLDTLGPCVWIRETRYHYRNRAHHQREHVFLARPDTTMPTIQPTLTEEERVGLLGRRWLESANVLRKMVLRGEIAAAEAREALGEIRDSPVTRIPHRSLIGRVWELRDNITAYDAAYVALAELFGVSILTCDAKLTRSSGHDAEIELYTRA